MNQSNSKSSIKFPLSKIHRLLRPLKSSITSLKLDLIQPPPPPSNQIYHESKSFKRKISDESDYHPNQKQQSSIIRKKIKSFSSHSQSRLISSPLFESKLYQKKHKKPFYGTKRLIKRFPLNLTNQSDLTNSNQIQIKLSKVLTAYKNILDSVTSSDSDLDLNSNKIQLTVICAQVIGFQLESILTHQSSFESDDHDEGNQISLIEEEDWKTSLMDEWYDAIPFNYRKYALAQHSLSLILNQFQRINSSNLSFDLFYKIHQLHRSYSKSNLISTQSSKLLISLFKLNQIDWYELYDSSYFQFNLKFEFLSCFYKRLKYTKFLNYWSNWKFGLISFIDKSIQDFGLIGFQKWINERSSLLKESLIKQEEIITGMRSSGTDSDFNHDYDCELIEEFDEKTEMILKKWIDSFVKKSLPNSIHSNLSRNQFDLISDLVFNEIQFDSYYNQNENVINQYNQLLISISLLIESHRFILSNLSIFKLPYTSIHSTPTKSNQPQEPIKLIKLLNFIKLDHTLLSKVSKDFLRSHQSTELFSILSPNEMMIPGLNELFEWIWNSNQKSLFGLGKVWIESLLKTDPISWWNGNEDQIRLVRDWLDDWFTKFNLDDQVDHQINHEDQQDKQIDSRLDTLTLGGKKFRKIQRFVKGNDHLNRFTRVGQEDYLDDDDEMRIGSKVSRVELKAKDDQDQQINVGDVKSDVDDDFGDHINQDHHDSLVDVKSDDDDDDDDEMMINMKQDSVDIKSDEEEEEMMNLMEDEKGLEGLVDVKLDEEEEEEEKMGSTLFGGSLRSRECYGSRRKISFRIKSDDDEMILNSRTSRKGKLKSKQADQSYQSTSVKFKSDKDNEDEEEDEMIINSRRFRKSRLKSPKDNQSYQSTSVNIKSDEDGEMITNSRSSRVSSRSNQDNQSYQSTLLNIKSDDQEDDEDEMRIDSKLFKTPLKSIKENPRNNSSETKPLRSTSTSSSEDEISFIKETYQTPISNQNQKNERKLRISNRIERIPNEKIKNNKFKDSKGKERFNESIKDEELDELDFLSEIHSTRMNRRSLTPWCRKSSRVLNGFKS